MAGLIGWSGIHKKITSPKSSVSAVALAKVAVYPSNFYNATFKLRYTGFKASYDILFSIEVSNGSLSSVTCFSIGFSVHNLERFFYKMVGNYCYIYASGSYESVYSESIWDVFSSDSRVDFNIDNTPVSVGGLDATEITNKIASFE